MGDTKLTNLINYLEYCSELGLEGIEMESSPFFLPVRKESARIQGLPNKPQPKSSPNPPSERTVATANISFDAKEIMDLSKIEGPSSRETMQKKVQAVTGNAAGDILRGLYAAFHQCQQCELHKGRTRFVFGEGPEKADLMFVGEGPGFEEDKTGRPFVGKAGQLLDKIIQAMGFERRDVFIANIVKCRPPNNRTPLPDEMSICGPIIERQVEVIQPKIIVALGKTALSYFKQEPVSIMRLRGSVFEWRGTPVMPTYHPAYILRNPASKREVWEDMKQVMSFLDQNKGASGV